MLRWLEVWSSVVGSGRSLPLSGCAWVWDFHVVAEQLLLVRSMASPQRLEEGLPGLPGLPGTQVLPGMPGAAGTATAAVGAVGPGQGSVNGQGLGNDPWAGVAVDPWEAARQQRIPDTPLTTPTTRSGNRQQQSQGNLEEQPWARYTGAVGRPNLGSLQQGMQPGFQQQQQYPGQVGHILFQEGFAQQGQQGQQQQCVGAPNSHTPAMHACAVPVVSQQQWQSATEVTQLKGMVQALQQGVNQLFSLFRSAGPAGTSGNVSGQFGTQSNSGVPVSQQFVQPPVPQPPFGQQYGEEAQRPPVAPFGLGGEPSGSGGLDVLSKTEKWLPGLPKPGHESWKDREMEIVGFHDYLVELRSWASLVSPKFAAEIAEAVATSQEIVLSMLTREQQSRAGRLLSILRAAFTGHGRAENIIRAFCEGITFGPSTATVQGGFAFNDNGYELLRILAREFTLQTRAEALAVRNELLQKQFAS